MNDVILSGTAISSISAVPILAAEPAEQHIIHHTELTSPHESNTIAIGVPVQNLDAMHVPQ